MGDWNQMHVIARGNMMIHMINGHVMSIFIDDDPTMAVAQGVIGLQIEGGGNVKVSFRNLWLKNLYVAATTFRGRTAVAIENSHLRVTVLHGGGHIAEIFDKRSGVNPLWVPNWPSIEPSNYDLVRHPEYGDNVEAKLLASIMGHNLCMDIFGGPSPEEAAVGIAVHGEGAVATYDVVESNGHLTMRAHFPVAQLQFERRIELRDRAVKISETVENLCGFDRPIAWTQHVTLGPPFLERGVTEFRVSATRSKGVGR